jgi:rhamnosyltransferase
MDGIVSAPGTDLLRVAGIILTYHPDSAMLRELVRAVCPQVVGLLIVDNGSPWDPAPLMEAVDAGLRSRIAFLWLARNVGVGAGHNRGIEWARQQGFSHVLLMDQDSTPAPDMVQQLFASLAELEARGTLVAGVGPRYVDRYTGHVSPFVRFGRFKLTRVACAPAGKGEFIETDFLITSGSLISMKILDDVGLMDEGLFIDHVDTEWVIRAKSRGYRVYGVCDAIMEHSLGTATTRIWVGRWRNVPLHSPERHYYVFRNSVVLFRRPYAPRVWIINDVVRLTYMAVFYPIFAPQRLRRIRLMLKGLWDGVRNVQGRTF